jgi:hypothetical protein
MAREAGYYYYYYFNNLLHTRKTNILNIGQKALADAGIKFDKVEQAFVGYVYGKLIQIIIL